MVYALAAAAAQPSRFFCAEYRADSGACASCYASFAAADGLCYAPQLSVPNCLMYSAPTACAICAYGFGLVDNHCVPLAAADPCRVYAANGKCILCRRDVLLGAYGCEPARGCGFTADCSHCAGNGACIRCRDGFSVQMDAGTGATRCVRARGPLRRCWATLDGGRCFSCDVNYYLDRGGCALSPAYRFEIDWDERWSRAAA